MADITYAPFSREQVESLTEYQEAGVLPPYVCTRHGGDEVKLTPTEQGLICQMCQATQDWAHIQTANGEWKKLLSPPEG